MAFLQNRLLSDNPFTAQSGGTLNIHYIADIVNYIRLNPEFFSEWYQSVFALRFAVQRNREAVCAAGLSE